MLTHRPVAVCVPVRNEQMLLPRLLDALTRQQGLAASVPTLCFFLDDCTDRSEAVIAAHAAVHGAAMHFVIARGGAAAPNAGRARRAAMAIGVDAVGMEPGALLLTTDADSVPAPDWIMRAARALESCEVVAGRIEREPMEGDAAHRQLEAYYDRLYAYRRAVDPVSWEPDAGHHYTGGANLGLTAQAYAALGGFAERACGEDALLVDEAMRAGLRVRRDAGMRVRTSSRRQGRAVGGLATALGRIDDAATAPVMVGDPRGAAWQYARHAAARAAFAQLPDRAAAGLLGHELGLSADHVIGVARDCPNAEAFATRIVPAAPDGERTISLVEAERMLMTLEDAMLGCAA